ncbi:MAG TPA: EamA family transporter, partial [Candidatus Dormibacteraeota bacterium]|nr:EamA family transporter [Candidatus Dormibacteraeota bacterium]
MAEVAAAAAPQGPRLGEPAISPRERRLAIIAALVTVVLWASAFVGIRAAGRVLSAGPLSLMRLLVGGLALGGLVLVRRSPMPRRADLRGLIICGLLWFGAYNVLLNQAEHMVDAGTAAMLVNIGPVLIALLSGLLLGEGFPRRLLVGCAIAFAGTVVIGLATSARGLEAGFGAVLCVAAAAAYAMGVTAEKPLLARNSALTVTWLACTIGGIVCLPFAPQLLQEVAGADATTLAWSVYLGVFPTAIGFSFWAYALARTSAGRLGATTYLVPPVAILLGWLLLGDVPPGLALAGGVLCLAGVAVTRG